MTKYLKYHKNYTEFGETYQLVLPLRLEGLVPDDDSVRLLSHELEECANKYTFVWRKSVGKWEEKCCGRFRKRFISHVHRLCILSIWLCDDCYL